MIAAGVNAKALSAYMGHSSIQISYDRYGHLMPGNKGEAAGLLDAYLDQVVGRTLPTSSLLVGRFWLRTLRNARSCT